MSTTNTEKKYASLDTLTLYDSLIKERMTTEISGAVSTKADSTHKHAIGDVTDLQSTLDTIDNTLSQKSQVQIIESDNSEILPTLKIHKLTQEEYEQAITNGTVDENALYLTPDEDIDLSIYATIESLDAKADIDHNHDDTYYTQAQVDSVLETKAAVDHSHDDVYYTETEIDTKIDAINESLNSKVDSSTLANYSTTVKSQAYTDNAVAQKTQVQIITWEADD